MTPQDRFNRLKSLVEDGVTGKVIAYEFGCHNTHISAICSVLGIKTKYTRIGKEMRAKILRDYSAGMPVSVICREYGCSGTTISRMANKAGLRRIDFAQRPLRRTVRHAK